MYTSYHQTGITRFRELFSKKRLDVMSDFTKGVSNGFDEGGMPKDPTEKQMQAFAKSKGVNLVEAWHMLRGEQMIGKLALQAIAFGYTPTTFKEELGETDRPPPGTVQPMVESSKRAKQDAMSKMVRKCVNAIYSVTSYSYFQAVQGDLNSNDMHKCIDPQDVVYSRPVNKWDRVMLLVMDQAKVTLLPLAQKTLEAMTHHHDARAFERWHSLLDGDQVQRLMDKYQEYGKNVVEGKWRPNFPSAAPGLEQPPSEAASSSQRAPEQEEHRRNGKGKGSGKSSKGQGATWRRIEWNHRSWNAYSTTLNDDGWNNPRIREARQSWDEWDRGQRAGQGEERYNEEEQDT